MATANEKLGSNSLCNGGLTEANKQCSTEIDYNETNGHLESNTEDISCEFFINNINNNNNTNTYDDSDHERLSASKIDTSYTVAITNDDNNKNRASSSITSKNVCDGWPAVAEQKNIATPSLEKRLRGRRGSVVLELNCTTQSFGEKGTCIENYTSKLTTDDGNNSDDSQGDGELVTNRKFEECATKSHRSWKEGDEVLTESEIKFREDERIIETKEGKRVSEYSFRTDENHVSTTYSFEILGDKVLRTSKTNRRSSTNSSMKMEKDSLDTSIQSSEKDTMSLPSSDTKVIKSSEDDKFAVSFNSDTSEDEDSDSEESVSSKSVSDVSNDITSGDAKNRVLCNGFKDTTEESSRTDESKVSGYSSSSEKVQVRDLFNELHYEKSENSNENEVSDQGSFSKQIISTHESEISRASKTSADDVTSIKHDKAEKELDCTSLDKLPNLSTGSLDNKKSDDVAPEPSFSFTVDCSETKSAHKKTFTVCKAEEATTEIPHDKDTAERKECTLLNNTADKTSNSSESSQVKSTLSSTSEEFNLSKALDEHITQSRKELSDLHGDIVNSEVTTPNKTPSSEQNKHMDILNNTEQHTQSKGDATFSSQQEFHSSKTTASKVSDLETEVAKLPAALMNQDATVNTAFAAETGNLIDISSDVSNSKNNAKLDFDEQQTIVTKTKEKMAENSLNSDLETNGGFKLSEKLITHEMTDKHEDKRFNDMDSLSSTDKMTGVDGRKYLDNFHMEKGFDDESMAFSTGKKRKEFKLFEDDEDGFGGGSYSDLKVMDEKDGSKAYEKTTTFIAGDRHSTDDLIKRILAEARGEITATNHRENYRLNMGDNEDIHSDRSYLEQRSTERSRRQVIDDRDSPVNNIPDYRQHQRSSSDREKEPSLLDRRLASMGFTSDHKTSTQGQGYDDYEETQYSSTTTTRGHDRQAHQPGGGSSLFDGVDSYGELDSRGSDLGSFKRQQFRSGLMRKQQAVFQDDWDNHDDDDEEDDEHAPYLRRKPAEEYIPDEEFVPKKAEDTDRVVKERTEEIRKVVDNQNNVLQRLKSASDSFDEISNEIKEIKQQFLDSQMRRSVILDEIEHERMFIDQLDHERQHEAQGLPAYGSSGRQQRISRQLEDDDYDFESKYRPVKPIASRTVELDKELEDDRLGRGTLSNLAIGGSGQTSYSSYAASAGSNYLNNYKSKYMDDLDMDNTYGASSNISSRSGYGSGYTTRGRRGRSQSMFDDADMDYDAGDYGISTSSKSRSLYSSKYGNSYQTDRAQNGDDDDTASESSSYKSPNLPSYRKYDYDSEQKSYGASSYSSPYKSRYGTGSSRSASTSRLSGMSRSKTMDYDSPSSSYDRPSYGASKYSSSSTSTSSGFSSKFLDKVRQKKASGEEIKRDKPFSSRFLGKSVDLTSNPSFARPSFGKDDSSKSSEPATET